MKFLKHLVFFLFGLVVVSSVLSFGGAQSGKNQAVEDDVHELESAVNNGQIISDGMIEEDQNPDAKPNAIGEGATAVGQKVTDGFASFLEMVGEMVTSIFG